MIGRLDLRIGAKYLHVPSGEVGTAFTYSPNVPEPFTTFGRRQFGAAGCSRSVFLKDLVPWVPPPADREQLEAWLG